MAIEVLTLEEALDESGITMLVHGPAGIGKTVLSITAMRPTLLLSAESGLLSLKKILRENPRFNKFVRVIKITCIQDLEDAYDLVKKKKVCDWICLDSISEIAEQILSQEKEISSDPRHSYGALVERMTVYLKKFRDLSDYHVLMTCKQKMIEEQDTGKMMYVPLLPGNNLGVNIPYLFDEVFALRIETDKNGVGFRTLQTDRDGKYEAKDRSGELDLFEKASLKHIEKKILGDDYVEYVPKSKKEVVDDEVKEEEIKEVVEENEKAEEVVEEPKEIKNKLEEVKEEKEVESETETESE